MDFSYSVNSLLLPSTIFSYYPFLLLLAYLLEGKPGTNGILKMVLTDSTVLHHNDGFGFATQFIILVE